MSRKLRPKAIIDAFLETQQSEDSRESVRWTFARVAKLLKVEPDDLPFGPDFDIRTYNTIKERLVRHTPSLAISTIRLTLQHVRNVMKVAWQLGAISHDQWTRLEAGFKPVRGSRITKGHSLTEAEVRRLLVQCEALSWPKAQLLRGVVLLAVGTGLRRAELCSLRLDKVKDDHLTVIAKGNKEVRVPLDATTAEALQAWLEVRSKLGWNHKLVFATPSRGTPLRPRYVSRVVRELSISAGLKQPIAPHDFRRTFASAMLEAGLSLPQVQRLMHHENAETTARYDRREEAALDEARRKVGSPWKK